MPSTNSVFRGSSINLSATDGEYLLTANGLPTAGGLPLLIHYIHRYPLHLEALQSTHNSIIYCAAMPPIHDNLRPSWHTTWPGSQVLVAEMLPYFYTLSVNTNKENAFFRQRLQASIRLPSVGDKIKHEENLDKNLNKQLKDMVQFFGLTV